MVGQGSEIFEREGFTPAGKVYPCPMNFITLRLKITFPVFKIIFQHFAFVHERRMDDFEKSFLVIYLDPRLRQG